MPALPSEKQLAFARGLAEKHAQPLPPDVEQDAKACSAFIASLKDRPVPPSKSQLDYAREIYQTLADRIDPPVYERAVASAAECRRFIEQHKEAYDAHKTETRAEAKFAELLNRLDFVPASLRQTLSGLASAKDRLEAVQAYRQGGAGFSGLDPARLESTQQKLIGYWLEGLQSTAFEGLGKLDNLLGDNDKARFDVDELTRLLDTAPCRGLDPNGTPPPVRHAILKLVKDSGEDKEPMVLSVLPLSPVPDPQDPRGYRWAGALDGVPRFNRNQIGESAKWPGLQLENVDDFDAWSLALTAARQHAPGDQPDGTLADAFGLWDAAFDRLVPGGRGGVRGWIQRYMASRHEQGQTKRRKPVFVLVDGGAATGTTRNVCGAYRQVLDDGDLLGRLPLFCAVAAVADRKKKAYVPAAEADGVDHLVRYFGHMDAFKKGRREAFPLDPAQRDALLALATTGQGGLLAVNGPPGTGKTSLLRGVIASQWVEPLLGKDEAPDCPIILACAATNQAVTNIISSFDETPGPALFDGVTLAAHARVGMDSRWLPALVSYGWYVPANAEKDTTYQKYQLLGRRGPQVPWEFHGVSKAFGALEPAAAEQIYLACAERHFGTPASLQAVLRELRRQVRADALRIVKLRDAATEWFATLAAFAGAGTWSAAQEARRQWLVSEIDVLAGRRGRAGAVRKEAARLDALLDELGSMHGWHGPMAALADQLLQTHADWRVPAVDTYRSLQQQAAELALLADDVDELRHVTLLRRLRRTIATFLGRDDTTQRWQALREAMQACGLPADGKGVPDFAAWAAAIAARREEVRAAVERAAAAVVRARVHGLDPGATNLAADDWRAELEHCLGQARARRGALTAEQAGLDERHRVHADELKTLTAAFERREAARTAARHAGLAVLSVLEGFGVPLAPDHAIPVALAGVLERDTAIDPEGLGTHRRGLLKHVQDWLDVNIRPRLFHATARYWEGRYLDSRLRFQNRLRANAAATMSSEEQLRELAMLAPVFVVTAYSAPKLMRRHLHGSAEGKAPYLFGEADLLIVDEAGQGTPEVGASAFLFARRAIVVGDVHQLEPVWNLGEAGDRLLIERFGIGAAGEDRYAGLRPSGVLMAHGSVMRMAQQATHRTDPRFDVAGLTLTNHYRCLAPIIEICNRMVYGGELSVATRPPDTLWRPELARLGYLVCDTVQNTKHPGGSRRNDTEATCIARWIRENETALRRHYDPDGNKDLADLVAIVTPFKGQKKALKSALAKEYRAQWPDENDENAPYNRMTIDTVHSLQGAEKPVVLFSMVETAAPAERQFYDQGTNLVNVAVSRAKEMFIVALTQQAVDYARALDPDKLRKPSDHLWHAVVTQGTRLNMRHLVVVESPAKRDAVHLALGGSIEWEVVATEGHVTELGSEAGWDVARAAKPAWGEVSAAGTRLMARLQGLWPGLATLYLATDPDPEGEAIAWHMLRLLQEQRRGRRRPAGTFEPPSVRRMRFHNLTPAEIRRARDEAGTGLDAGLVKSALVRTFLDRIVMLHYAHRLGLAPANQAALGVGRVQLGILDLVDQAEARPPGYRTRVDIPLTDDTCLHAYLATSPDQGPADIHGARDAAHAQVIVGKLASLFGRPDVTVTLSWSGIVRQEASYPALNTARFLALAYRELGLAPDHVMTVLQGLYEGTAQAPAAGRALAGSRPGTGPDADTSHAVPAVSSHPMLEPLDYGITPETASTVLAGDALSVYSLLWKAALATAAEGPAYRDDILQIAVSTGDAEPVTPYLQAREQVAIDDGWGVLLPDEAARRVPDGTHFPAALRTRLDAIPAALDGHGGRRRDEHACASLAGLLAHPRTWRCAVEASQPALRCDGLLEQMAAHGVGRPSTFAGRLRAALDNQVVADTVGGIVVGNHGRTLLAALKRLPPADRVDARYSSELEQALQDVERSPSLAGDVLASFSRRATGIVPPLAAWLDALAIDGESLEQALHRAEMALPAAVSWDGDMVPRGLLPSRLARRHEDAAALRAALDALLAGADRDAWRRLRPRDRALRRLAAFASLDGAAGPESVLRLGNRDIVWRWWFDLGPAEAPVGADELDAIMADTVPRCAQHRPALDEIRAALLTTL